MSAEHTVHIEVTTQYLQLHSKPEAQRFVFAYTIRIHNRGDEAVQLLSRHWRIIDGNNKLQEVKGEGVVGEQPVIQPGTQFSYTSSAMLETAAGTMEGSYQMRGDSGDNFEAAIPMFSLSRPGALH